MNKKKCKRQLIKPKKNSESKPVKFRLKIDLVSYPVRVERLVNTYEHVSLKTKDNVLFQVKGTS